MSDFLNKYPYTDFHELNLDWVIERVKKLTEDWAATLEEWNSTEEQWQELYNYVHDYFDNLDVQQEINNKINAMILDGTFQQIATPIIQAKVATDLPGVVSDQIGSTVAGQIDAVVASQIGGTVASQIDAAIVDPVNTWLTAHITQPTTPVVDTSLSIPGAAADAAVVGADITDLKNRMIYPYGAIEEMSGIKSMPFCRDNYSLTDGSLITENAAYKFIDGLINPSTTLFVRCTRPDLFNTFVLKYNKADDSYVGWEFIDTTFGNEWAYLSSAYKYRIAITKIDNDHPNPTLEDAKYVLIWEIKSENYADYYKPQTYLTDRSLFRKHRFECDGELELTWVRENRRLSDGSIIENSGTHNMITSIEMIDCTSESVFISNNTTGDLFLIKFASDGTYDSWDTAINMFGKQAGWLPLGYKYYPLITTGDLSEQFEVRIFNSRKNNIHVPNDLPTIQIACDFAKDGDTIFIANGTYEEAVSVYTKNVNIIGESRDYCIIKTTTDKYSEPPLEMAVGSLKNLTLLSTDTDRDPGETEDHAYALHIDYPQLIDNDFVAENCRFLAKNNSAAGIGLRNNSRIQFVDCEFICDNSYALFAHTQTNAMQTGSNQFLEVDHCILESKTLTKCLSLMKALDNTNNGTFTSYYSIYKANNDAPTDYDRKAYLDTGGTFEIDAFSFGNNVSHMNGNKHN